MKLISAVLIGLIAAQPLTNSQQKHAAAIARKEAIIAAKKEAAQARAQRFQDATAAHKLNAQNKKAEFEAHKLQKEAAKARKEAAEEFEAAAVKAAKDAKQAVKDANHAAKLQKAQDQKDAVQANADENEAHVASKKMKSIKSQLKTCNRKLAKYRDFSGNDPADFDAAVAQGATGFDECNDWLDMWVAANGEGSWIFHW